MSSEKKKTKPLDNLSWKRGFVADLLFNNKEKKTTLECLNIEHMQNSHPTFSSSPFNYSTAGHVITGYVNKVNNDDLKSLILKGPKFREPWYFNWQSNFIHIDMESVEEYAKRCAKYEKGDIDTLAECS